MSPNDIYESVIEFPIPLYGGFGKPTISVQKVLNYKTHFAESKPLVKTTEFPDAKPKIGESTPYGTVTFVEEIESGWQIF